MEKIIHPFCRAFLLIFGYSLFGGVADGIKNKKKNYHIICFNIVACNGFNFYAAPRKNNKYK